MAGHDRGGDQDSPPEGATELLVLHRISRSLHARPVDADVLRSQETASADQTRDDNETAVTDLSESHPFSDENPARAWLRAMPQELDEQL